MLILPRTKLSQWLDHYIVSIGKLSSWLWLLLLVVIVTNVLIRYLFGMGRIEFEEIQWHLYAAGFLIALSYAYVEDAHVRVDVVRNQLSPKMLAWVELYGTLLLLLPFILLVLWASIPFVSYSFITGEISEAPGGLPYRWFIKGFLVLGFVLLLFAMSSRLSRVSSFLFAWPEAIAETNVEKKGAESK